MKVKIITDSCCDMPYEDEQAHKDMIDIMSFDITLGDETFRERIDVTPQEFFEKIDNSPHLPKTAQITVPRFEEKFTECFNEGYDAIICVLINSTGSQTYSNALQAKKNLEEELDGFKNMRLEIIDTHCYSVGYGYPVLEAAKKLEAGQSVDSVVDYLVDMFNCCEIYIIGFELRHMKKSGRINAAAAFLGEMMGLKPIISLIDGESVVVKKSRGDKNAIRDAAQYVAQQATPETPWQILRADEKELTDEFIKIYSDLVGSKPVMDSYCGAAVATNTGPHMIGIVIRGKARR
ncbi:MAG: DegV family protein [Eubacterium sp.]|nr:DegV family protein [Eubacterium sp.]